jgi:carbamoyltransferase
MHILGIWDGHDAGAAMIESSDHGIEIKAAANEERFTKRKLEINFPKMSIDFCLKASGVRPEEIRHIAVSTTDTAKTLTRIFPRIREDYYKFRRRKVEKPMFVDFRRNFKYWLTEIKEKPGCRQLSAAYFHNNLKGMGFKDYKLHFVEHHEAHATAAAFCSGFDKSTVLTIDGVGDGLSGTVSVYENGRMERLSEISGKDSLGIFFEHVTTILGMRELEDEGKVMALANFAYEIPDEKNKFMNLFEVDGLQVKSKMGAAERYNYLNNVSWNTTMEDFSFMAQRTLEVKILQLFENAIERSGVGDVAWSGGVASNVKVNMLIKNLPGLKRWFVFPHMGDGGLALGAALKLAFELTGQYRTKFDNVYFGPEHPEEAIVEALRKNSDTLKFERIGDVAGHAADMLAKDKYILWYQGRMEYGPRALGNRSIVAPADSLSAKDALNLRIKRRDWFQPFCPSLIEEDARKIFSDLKGYDRFMTMAYQTEPNVHDHVKAVVNVDGSARPQMLGNENPLYRKLIEGVKKHTGYGIILNTSFNLHGYPIVNTPDDAIEVMLKNKAPYLIMGNYFVEFNK